MVGVKTQNRIQNRRGEMLSLESKNCSIMAKSAGGGGEGEDEIELELGLSIGRSYNKKSKPDSNDTTYNGVVSSFMGCVDDDPLRLSEKSEIQTLRRQEAKKKRDARRQVKRSNLLVQPESKKPKRVDCSGSGQDQVVNVKSVNQSLGFAAQYHPYPCANGGVVIPCWMTGVAGAGPGSKERNVIQPVARYGSCPLQVLSDTGFNLGRGYESERNGGNRIAVGSNGSSMCNSSAGSDCRSTSYEGGGSYDTRSHSSHTTRLPEDANAHLRHGATSLLKESTNNPEKVILFNTTAQSNPISPIEDLAKSATEKMLSDSSDHKHASADESPSSSGPSKDCTAKPPKPQKQNQNSDQLSYMPCVSTTGNGPNGRTINGFLYRYTKAEVSIVCICHGTSFSPAEFVLHAGGTDVSHPLRHITVIPSVI